MSINTPRGEARALSIVIPNWNGVKMLGGCLEAVTHALHFAGYSPPWDVIIADDGSTDGSVDLVREQFPWVRLALGQERSGFIANANRGIQFCRNPYFLLLNNDVILHEEFLAQWQDAFDDPDVFSVTPLLLRPDGVTFDSGRRVGVWDHGLIRHWVVCKRGEPGPTLYGSGGASIYATDKFRVLGGLDDLYRPMYMEDLDISYRGWKRGWKTIYQPACLAYHHGSVSSKKVYQQRELSGIIAKNHFLFIWKNVTDRRLFQQHLLWLPFWMAQAWRPGRRVVSLAFFKALAQTREAFQKRTIERSQERISDAELWKLFRPTSDDFRNSPYLGLAGTA
ncbi:MAG TPA: glycosyltransferase family 2 protein [Chloroflexota bacterium]|nr:glycosyltransferase family 2 protein [Chloroflexota bacterium]